MKTLFSLLTLLIVLLVFGCQENSITDPLKIVVDKNNISSSSNSNSKVMSQFQKLLNDPFRVGNSFYKIFGELEYQIKEKRDNQNFISTNQNLLITIKLDADLQYFCTVCEPPVTDELSGFISETTDVEIQVNSNTVTFLQNAFPVHGCENGMVLNVQFSISLSNVQLSTMWLSSVYSDDETTNL